MSQANESAASNNYYSFLNEELLYGLIENLRQKQIIRSQTEKSLFSEYELSCY